jgi:hypothetical protein
MWECLYYQLRIDHKLLVRLGMGECTNLVAERVKVQVDNWMASYQYGMMKDRLKRVLDRVKHYLIGAVPYRCFVHIFCYMPDLKF